MKTLRRVWLFAGAGLCAFQVGGCSLMDFTDLFGGVLGG